QWPGNPGVGGRLAEVRGVLAQGEVRADPGGPRGNVGDRGQRPPGRLPGLAGGQLAGEAAARLTRTPRRLTRRRRPTPSGSGTSRASQSVFTSPPLPLLFSR